MSVRIAGLIAAIIVTIATTSIAFAPSASACSSGYYKAASGDCVHKPVCTATQPPDATALCGDGCWSFTEHPYDDDSCHGRGGVQRVL
jgi:Protein of unknown function (DUF3761)